MNFSKNLSKCIVLIFIMLFFIQVRSSFSYYNYDNKINTDDLRILTIYSYDPGFDTVMPIASGIQSAFSGSDVYIGVEFMNSKGSFINQHFYNYYMSLKYKLNNTVAYDMVFVVDDNALIFIQKYGDILFPNTPIIFTGINNIDNAIVASKSPYITGIVEKTSIASTIELALKALKPCFASFIFCLLETVLAFD